MNIMKATNGKMLATIGAGVAVLLMILLVIFIPKVTYSNKAISQEEGINRANSNIETIVQNRSDTLTQLINAVKDSKKFEQETLEKVMEARTQAQNGDIAQSNMTIKAVAEAYPELKTIELYKTTMNSTTSIENKMNSARIHYNDLVSQYRVLYRSFPSSFYLNMGGPEQKDFKLFEANDSAKKYNPTDDNLWDN